jgi:hypothetical protein
MLEDDGKLSGGEIAGGWGAVVCRGTAIFLWMHLWEPPRRGGGGDQFVGLGQILGYASIRNLASQNKLG